MDATQKKKKNLKQMSLKPIVSIDTNVNQNKNNLFRFELLGIYNFNVFRDFIIHSIAYSDNIYDSRSSNTQ